MIATDSTGDTASLACESRKPANPQRYRLLGFRKPDSVPSRPQSRKYFRNPLSSHSRLPKPHRMRTHKKSFSDSHHNVPFDTMLTLTSEQKTFFRDQGYLILRASEHGLLHDPTVLPGWSEEVRTWPLEASRGKWMPYFEDTSQGRQIMRTEKFVDYHDGLQHLLCGGDLQGILAQLGGDVSERSYLWLTSQEMILFKDKINYKLPGGNGFEAHLDAPAYDHINGKVGQNHMEHLTANIAIHPATMTNGCLEVVPTSHKMQVELAHGGLITDKWCDAHEWTTVPLEVGDILIFGSHLAHRSGSNKSTMPRAMLYATYSGKSEGEDLREKYYAHRRVAFPPDHGEVINGEMY